MIKPASPPCVPAPPVVHVVAGLFELVARSVTHFLYRTDILYAGPTTLILTYKAKFAFSIDSV